MRVNNQIDKYLMPINSPIVGGTSPMPTVVPWKWGIQQGLQTKKIKSSTGYFKKLSAGALGTANINNGTLTNSLFNGGSVTNTSIQNGTFPNGLFTGGTLNNVIGTNDTFNSGTFGTPQINGGTLGTPQLNHGTLNPDVYQASGTSGTVGSIIYIKTIAGPTYGTMTFSNGIILSF